MPRILVDSPQSGKRRYWTNRRLASRNITAVAPPLRDGHHERLPRPFRPLRRRDLLRLAQHRLLRHQLARRRHSRGLHQTLRRRQKGLIIDCLNK